MIIRNSIFFQNDEIKALYDAREALWLRHERTVADASALREYAASLGPHAKPSALPELANVDLLSPVARDALAGIQGEAAQVAALHDEIQRRRARIVELRKQIDRARRSLRIAAIYAVVVLIGLLIALIY